MNEDGAPFDSAFDDTGPFRVSPESGSVSLESALRDFGPAAIDDLIPRIRGLAAALDAAHRAGVVHGALHPGKIFVTDEATSLVAGKGAHAPLDAAQGKPYAAPEVLGGHGAEPTSDQYSLAAITYEWMFGRPLPHHGDRPIEFRAMPDVDRLALSRAFNRALSPKPEDRFASCTAFVDAVAGAVVPELPLLAGVEDFSAEDELAPSASAQPESDELRRDEPAILPVELDELDAEPENGLLIQAAPDADDAEIGAKSIDSEGEEAFLAQGTAPDLDAIDPRLSEPEPAAVPAWNPAAAPTPPRRTMETPRFGPVALFLAVIVGAVVGFAAGYMAKPRALQGGAPGEFTVPTGTETEVAKTPDVPGTNVPEAPAPTAPQASQKPQAPVPAATRIGRLLVRSTPSGASVTVDGVAKGVTPLALRDLDVGTRDVTIARRGYIPENRKVSITRARPARTLDVRLASASQPVPPQPSGGGVRPSTPATLGTPAATTGTLAVDSRPAGAAVTINGKPSGSTPLTINDLPPGDYRIVMTLPGYRTFATTVRVVAGERVRAAASLTAVEQE